MTFADVLARESPSQALLFNVLEQATSGLFLWRPDSDQVLWSPKLHATLNYPPDSIAHFQAIQGITHPDDIENMGSALEGSRSTRSLYAIKVRIRENGGEYRFFDVQGSWHKTEDGEDLLLGFLIDRTDMEAANRRAQRSEALFRAFFDNVPAAVFIKDKQYRHLYGNRQAAALAGVSHETFMTKSLHEIFDVETAEALATTDDRVFRDRETIIWSGEIENADGAPRFIIDTKFPVEDPESGEVMVGGFGLDITPQRNAEIALEKSQRLEAIGQLTAGVAHDFNNTMAVIQGSLELMPLMTDPAEAASLRQEALAAVRTGAQLTQHLLTYARQSPLEPVTTDLNTLLEGMDKILRRTLPESIEIATTPEAALWPTKLDVAQVESAILNLAINARDAMPEGGRLSIQTSNIHVDETTATSVDDALAPGRYVVLAVRDTGLGMPQSVRERAFEPFFTTKPAGRGTGMGLAMIYGLMKQFGGLTRIHSEEGRGTTVNLFFPADVSAVTQPQARPATDVSTGTEHILLVEDEDRLRAVLKRQLESLGYAVTAAENGSVALAMLEAGLAVDLLLSDIVMPGLLTGPRLAERARQLTPGLPVMFLSGYPNEATSQDGGFLPGDVIVMKPASRETLSHEIRRVLARRG